MPGAKPLANDRPHVADPPRDAPLDAVSEVVHGTTVGSNTLLQKTGAITGVLTTTGFRDVLEIGRIRTPTMFDLTWKKPEPLAVRRHRREVRERIAADGQVVTPMDEQDVREAGAGFVADGVESVAICFINSFGWSGESVGNSGLIPVLAE